MIDANEFEYELIDIDFGISYDLPESSPALLHEDDPAYLSHSDANNIIDSPDIVCDAEGIPMGHSKEEVVIRRKLIYDHIQQWRTEHKEEPRVYNEDLKDYIKVNQVFMLESVNHAVGNYKSTKAVMRMEEVMAKAKTIGTTLPKDGNSNQRPFQRMIIMRYHAEDIGDIKMVVGVRNRTKENVEYSITVPDAYTPFIDDSMKEKPVPKKKKKRSR